MDLTISLAKKARLGERKWKIKDNKLIVSKNGKKEWTFKPLEKKIIDFEYENQIFSTTEITMIKSDESHCCSESRNLN